MALFEYLIVLISVVISMGLARVPEAHADLLKGARAVRWSPTYLAWLVVIVVFHIDLWASLWSLHTAQHWTWMNFGACLMCATSLFCVSVLASLRLAEDAPT